MRAGCGTGGNSDRTDNPLSHVSILSDTQASAVMNLVLWRAAFYRVEIAEKADRAAKS